VAIWGLVVDPWGVFGGLALWGRGLGVFWVGLVFGYFKGGVLYDRYIFRLIRTVYLCQFLINPWRVSI